MFAIASMTPSIASQWIPSEWYWWVASIFAFWLMIRTLSARQTTLPFGWLCLAIQIIVAAQHLLTGWKYIIVVTACLGFLVIYARRVTANQDASPNSNPSQRTSSRLRSISFTLYASLAAIVVVATLFGSDLPDNWGDTRRGVGVMGMRVIGSILATIGFGYAIRDWYQSRKTSP